MFFFNTLFCKPVIRYEEVEVRKKLEEREKQEEKRRKKEKQEKDEERSVSKGSTVSNKDNRKVLPPRSSHLIIRYLL